jgi:type VI secretion system protein ImpH
MTDFELSLPTGMPASPDMVRGYVAAANSAARGSAAPRRRRSVTDELFDEPYRFEFFQSMRLLERALPTRRPVGREGSAATEVVRFRALQSLTFPPSSIYELTRPQSPDQTPVMTVAFMGLTGPSGVLPRHYTELMLRLERASSSPQRYALRDWFDLFNHRFISLFFRAWEKYRFFIAYGRGDASKPQPDVFTSALESLIGHGTASTKGRLRVSVWDSSATTPRENVLAKIEHLSLLRFAGMLAQRPRCVANLQALLTDYFAIPVSVEQFQGRWLRLDEENQFRLGRPNGNCQLGIDSVLGDRVWDVQSKIRLRLGLLSYAQFQEFLPDPAPCPRRKALFLLSHLVRLFAGQELDFDVQLVLRRDEVPQCSLGGNEEPGSRLGWNTWLTSKPLEQDTDDAVFAGNELRWIDTSRPAPLHS